MGDVIDLRAERAKRQAQTDRATAHPVALPRPTPLIDRDWDNELGRMIETVHVPPYHRDRDSRDDT